MPIDADKLQKKIWDEEVKMFEQFNNTVKINGIAREYKPQEFVSVMASGKGPDIVRIPIAAIPLMAKYGFLAKLDKWTNDWAQKDYMPAIMWNSVNVEGNIYGIPYDSYFTTLFYRRSIFEKCGIESPPKTWDDVIEDSKIINKKLKNVWGIALQPDMFIFMDFIWQHGGNFYDNNEISLDNPSVAKVLKLWHDIKWKHKITPPQNIFYDYDVEQLFSTGKIAMMIGVANKLPKMSRRYGLDLNDVDIVPLPEGPDKIKAWHAGGDAFIINAFVSEDRKNIAWEYIKFVLSPLNQLWKWKRMKELKMIIFPGDFSCATNLINMPEFKKVKGLLEYAHSEPTFYKWPMIKEDFNKYVLEKIFIEKDIDFETMLYDFSVRIKKEYYGR
jgi:ABC-type glycerol-3-phosphate transport system substrate-binding protein